MSTFRSFGKAAYNSADYPCDFPFIEEQRGGRQSRSACRPEAMGDQVVIVRPPCRKSCG